LELERERERENDTPSSSFFTLFFHHQRLGANHRRRQQQPQKCYEERQTNRSRPSFRFEVVDDGRSAKRLALLVVLLLLYLLGLLTRLGDHLGGGAGREISRACSGGLGLLVPLLATLLLVVLLAVLRRPGRRSHRRRVDRGDGWEDGRFSSWDAGGVSGGRDRGGGSGRAAGGNVGHISGLGRNLARVIALAGYGGRGRRRRCHGRDGNGRGINCGPRLEGSGDGREHSDVVVDRQGYVVRGEIWSRVGEGEREHDLGLSRALEPAADVQHAQGDCSTAGLAVAHQSHSDLNLDAGRDSEGRHGREEGVGIWIDVLTIQAANGKGQLNGEGRGTRRCFG